MPAPATPPSWFRPTPIVVGLHVRRFKNLRDVWLPWSSRMVLIGPNGAGKTNLLDCCALLMGTSQTKALAEKRVTKKADYDISVIVKNVPILLTESWLNSIESPYARSLGEVVGTAPSCIALAPMAQSALRRAAEEGLVRFRSQALDGNRIWKTTLVASDTTAREIRKGTASNASLPPPRSLRCYLSGAWKTIRDARPVHRFDSVASH